MSEFYLSEDFYPIDFINHVNKLRNDFQYLNNQRNITDWSETVTAILGVKIGLKIKIRSSDKLILGHVNIKSTKKSLILWYIC